MKTSAFKRALLVADAPGMVAGSAEIQVGSNGSAVCRAMCMRTGIRIRSLYPIGPERWKGARTISASIYGLNGSYRGA